MNGADNLKRSGTQSSFGKGLKRSDSFVEEERHQKRRHDILACLEEGTEGCITLVGSIDDIDRPIVAFVRMAEAIALPNTIEVSLPVRFVIIILTPTMDMEYDAHEIGRSISTLMSNQAFHNVCYNAQEKRDLLHGINEFLGDSVVLPPGDWDKAHLLHMGEMMDMKRKMKARKATLIHQQTMEEGTKPVAAGAPDGGDGGGKKNPEKGSKGPRNPLKRTTTQLPCDKTKTVTMPFGGLIDDIKHRYVSYKSDILDGLNTQCIAAAIFIYFAALSGAIAFGGLMGAKTDNHIGISETLIVSSVAGVVFSLFAGCPLIIIGVTGPVLLYEEALYGFSLDLLPNMFLYWRVWVGIWTFVIALLVAGFQGSTLVRFFTKFTKDIFASLVALLFIFEAFNKLVKIFKAHPLQETYDYCSHLPDHCHTFNDSSLNNVTRLSCTADVLLETSKAPQPNTALMSMILMFGTFFIAYFLRIFRNSQYLGRNARRALGDFGVPIAIVIMVLVDWSAGDTFTEKLTVPEGISVTDSTLRGWVIPATGTVEHPLPVWAMFAAVIPALLLYLLLFMETHICELIMMEKTKEKKGAGLHLDIVLLALINLVSGAIGGPWICAATVRAVSHVSALTVMSTTHVPGEAPKVVGIRDQRMTAFTVSVLLGVSVLLAPILKLVPFAVLFGVFLYMGVSGMNGVQFFDRVSLCFMPVKHHPPVSYVQNVKTWRMVLFTVLQAFGLALLWAVKSFKQIALAFPFFVILMIPYRYLLKFIFTERELSALDGAQAGTNLSGLKPDEEEKDFFETAAECPITPNTEAPLHRAMTVEELKQEEKN
jgi:solute carrier family 4 anion exchanger 2